MLSRTGHSFEAIMARMRADRAAKGVAGALDLDEEEVCEMHDTDKLGRSATGALVRTRMKVAINPFPEGVALIDAAHKLGVHFGYGNRHEELMKVAKTLGNVPEIRIQVDYNTTRISAVHGLLLSEARLNRALKAYEIQYTPGWAFKAEDWRGLVEFEAVLNATRITATLAQVERDYMGAYTCVIKSMALSTLRADTLKVIELDKVGLSPKLLRANIKIEDMSGMGQTARTRAILEGERRWCGNQTETLTGAAVQMGRHELLCMLLDKRTLGCHHVTAAQRHQAVVVFHEEYVKYYLQASKWDHNALKESREKAEALRVDADDDDSGVKTEAGISSLFSGSIFQGSSWSDDGEEDEEEEIEEMAKETFAKAEAERVLKNWKKYPVDWRDLFPSLKEKKKEGESLDLTEDLMRLDIGNLYKSVQQVDAGRQLLGFIPAMASCSTGQLGALSAESYCERILSCANNVIMKGNTLLSDEELEMIVVLRMNKEFMQFMREHYSAEAKELFGQTVVRD